MNETNRPNVMAQQEEEPLNLYALVFKYIVYWPWFIVSVLVCLIGTYVYLRYQAPVYNVKSAVLIKEQDGKNKGAASAFSAMQEMGMMSMTSRFDNEVQILKSQTLVKKVVTDLKLYIQHSEKRSFGYNLPLYQNEPVKVFMTPEEADKLTGGMTVEMDYRTEGNLEVEVEYTLQGEKKTVKQRFEQLPAALPTEVGVLTFTPDTAFVDADEVQLVATIVSPTRAAAGYCANMTVAPTSKTTTIAQIDVKNTVKQRGVDFIYKLVEVYNQDANDEKNEVAAKTATFIEERIAIINKELGSTEDELADFKQRSRLTNLTSDAQIALQESSRYEQQLAENATQINLVQYLQDYINNPANKDEVIPANVGLQDQNLAAVISQYNTMVVERKRLLRTSSESNPAVVNLNTGIEVMRATVQTTVNSVLNGLQIAERNLKNEAKKHEGRISDAPTQEKKFISIQRQQEIKDMYAAAEAEKSSAEDLKES
ncbi:MAG: tyrosine protein kinase, partial [Firmicutes bacterium]|nr:tyrosine protein kinase [Bacillota bacterium]